MAKTLKKALLVALAVMMVITFMPNLGMAEKAYADGEYDFYFDNNSFDVYYYDGDENVELDAARGDLYNNTGVEPTYQWYVYYEDEGYEPVEGETGLTYYAPASYGEYKLVATVEVGEDTYSANLYFYVSRHCESYNVTIEFVPNGAAQIPEYDHGWWTNDDGKEYFYYDFNSSMAFADGDRVILKDEDGKVIDTFTSVKKYDEDEGEYYYSWNSQNGLNYNYWTYDYYRLQEGQSAEDPLTKGKTYHMYMSDFRFEATNDDGDYFYGYTDITREMKIVDNPNLLMQNGLFYRTYGNNESAYLFHSDQNISGAVTIPSTVTIGGKSKTVREIEYETFMDRKGITSVTIPESLKYIESYAFVNTGLKSITVPPSVIGIGNYAFGYSVVYDKYGNPIYSLVDGFTLYTPAASYAAQWAKENGIKVVDPDAEKAASDKAASDKAVTDAKAAQAAAEKKAADAATQLATAQTNYDTLKASSDATSTELEKAKAELATAQAELTKAQKALAKTKTVTKFKAKAQKKGKAQLTWKKTAGVTGYQIQRSLKKTKGFKAIKLISKAKTVKFIDKKLKKGTTYYYRIRTYTNVAGKKVYGKWSDVVPVKAKK